jgi:hypothetical protein
MSIRQLLCFLTTLLGLTSGCLARQVAEDGNGIRQALVAMYTDQALDNLVRAYESRPFVQLKYSMLSVKDTDDLMATGAGGEADFGTSAVTDLTKAGTARFTNGRSFAGKFPVSSTGERDRVMSFHADPVIDQTYIYDDYLKFAHDPKQFVASPVKPSCPVYLCKNCGAMWYWIPIEAGPAFLQLIVDTSFAPPPAAPAEVYYDATITGFDPQLDVNKKVVPFHYVLTLSKAVPNDDGIIQVVLKDGRKPWLPAFRLQQDGLPDGAPTKLILTQFNPTTLASDAQSQLVGSAILFFSQHFPNVSAKAAADNQKVLDALEAIRLQLLKPNPALP